MRKHFLLFTIFLFISLKVFAQQDVLTQVSVIDALMQGDYNGQVSIDDLKSYGNFGLGTFDALDGEMVILDGHIYQIKFDGSVNEPNGSVNVPFATVVNFKAEISKDIDSPLSMEEFIIKTDSLLPSPNYFYAIKLTGVFDSIEIRSLPRQEKPYRPLVEAVKEQSVFSLQNVEGTIVGFRCPPYVKDINVPGYHFHFLTKDRKTGGHVLDFKIKKGFLQADKKLSFHMILPDQKEFENLNFSSSEAGNLNRLENK